MTKTIRFDPDEYTMNWLVKTANLNGITVPKLVEACVGYCTTVEDFILRKYGDERRDPKLSPLARDITAGGRDMNQDAYRKEMAQEALKNKLASVAVYNRGSKKRDRH